MDFNLTKEELLEIVAKQEEQLKKQESQIKKLEKGYTNLENECDKLLKENKSQREVIESILALIEKKEFQRVSQILRTYGIKSEKIETIVNEAEIIKEESTDIDIRNAEEIENVLKNKTKKKNQVEKLEQLI